MRKRIIPIIMVFLLTATVSAQAVSARTVDCFASLQFNGTTANCFVDYTSGNSDDYISVTMSLWQGNTRINSWATSGYGIVTLSKTATVEKGKTYELRINSTVNGVVQDTYSVTNRS